MRPCGLLPGADTGCASTQNAIDNGASRVGVTSRFGYAPSPWNGTPTSHPNPHAGSDLSAPAVSHVPSPVLFRLPGIVSIGPIQRTATGTDLAPLGAAGRRELSAAAAVAIAAADRPDHRRCRHRRGRAVVAQAVAGALAIGDGAGAG